MQANAPVRPFMTEGESMLHLWWSHPHVLVVSTWWPPPLLGEDEESGVELLQTLQQTRLGISFSCFTSEPPKNDFLWQICLFWLQQLLEEAKRHVQKSCKWERKKGMVTNVEIMDDGFASCDGVDDTYARWEGSNTAM